MARGRARAYLGRTGPAYPTRGARTCPEGQGRLAQPRGHDGPELLVELDRGGELSLGEQLVGGIREAIRAGRLPPGAALPSTRGLAAELGRLARPGERGVQPAGRRGLSHHPPGRAGAGERGGARRRPARARPLAAGALTPTTSTPACPTSRAFPASAGCARCARRCASRRWTRSATATRAGCPSCARRSPTTSARVRGAAADTEQMTICTGFMQGFSLACGVLRGHGVDVDRARGPRLARAPADRRAGGPRGGADPRRRRGAAGGRADRERRGRGGRGDTRAPVPHRGGAQPRPPRRAGRVGRARGAADRRGRLRRRVPLRPRRGGRAAGARRPSACSTSAPPASAWRQACASAGC